MGKIRRSFTADKKRQVIEYAEKHGNRAAEKEFNIAESNIRFWRKNKIIIEAMPRTLRSLRLSKARWPDLEQDLKEIVFEEQRNSNRKIRPCHISKWALELAHNKYGLDGKQFRARPTWVFSFCRRHGIKIGRKKDCLKSKEARRLLALYQENRDHSYNKFQSEEKTKQKMTDKSDKDQIKETTEMIDSQAQTTEFIVQSTDIETCIIVSGTETQTDYDQPEIMTNINQNYYYIISP